MSYLVPSEYLQKFSPKEIQELKRAFKQFDLDQNGSIDTNELSRVLLAVGEVPTDELVADLIASVDTDKSGTIEFQEFLTLLYELRHPVQASAPSYPTGPMFCNDAAVSSWNTTFTKPPSPMASPKEEAPRKSNFLAASAAFSKGKAPVTSHVKKTHTFVPATSSPPPPPPQPVAAAPVTHNKAAFVAASAKFNAKSPTTTPPVTPGTKAGGFSSPASHTPVQRTASALASVVQKHLNIHESRSATGGKHSYSEEEKTAFAEHINNCLSGDAQLPYLPINPTGHDFFGSVTDGILLCKLINLAVPDTIDIRAVNIKNKLNVYEMTENHNLCINAAKSIGCSIVNIGPSDLLEGKEILVLGLVWQIIRIQLTATINLKSHPELVRLLLDGESLEDFMKLPPEQILLRWVNYHLTAAHHDKKIHNFGRDVADATAYSVLLHQIAPTTCDLCREPTALDRATHVIRNAQKLHVDAFIKPGDITSGNTKLNMSFVAQLFNTCPALDQVDVTELKDIWDDDVGDTREERCFRMWINSLGLSDTYVNHLFADLKDGLVILKTLDKMESGVVSWTKANVAPANKFKKVENCNYCVVLGKQLKFSLVNIGGVDIAEGNKKLVLSLIWQMMRHNSLKLLSSLGKDINDKDIIDWANAKVRPNGHQKQMVQFRDLMLSDAIYLLDLVAAVEPRAVNWDAVVIPAASEEDKAANAKYAISCARKIGATVFLTYEDIVEVKPKMIMTFVASLMALGKRH
ncbi:fimbrin [Thraustotheca clavata]|uniref:Fimbrin n=1 Tax=Thraustotheca clavata TaxID=74557 RepID=A0A1W0A9R8_9STRA|nr:fimbrin [Thraustotheca clavata]